MKKVIIASVKKNNDGFFAVNVADEFTTKNVNAIRNEFMLKAVKYFGISATDCNVEIECYDSTVASAVEAANRRASGYEKAMDKVTFSMLFDSIVNVSLANL